jgi:two-component system phosphate regulon response regulator PhoB
MMKKRNISNRSDDHLVLIVDDNEDERILMSRALLQEGFRVTEAATGEEAVTALQDLQPQVVVLDLFIPCIGGLGVSRLIRAEPEGQDALIIMLSGLQDAGTIRRAYDAGASDFFAKPSVGSTLQDYAAMAKRIRHLLRNQHHTVGNGIE